TANPQWVASDLIAQAEHDPGCCFLVSTSATVIEDINKAIEEQLPLRKRRAPIEKALTDWSAAIVVPDDAAAYEIADEIAAEHVTLATANPYETLRHVKHGGAWFLGHGSPVASGDYYAGPSHCLPTSSTARYTSGLSTYSFMKRSSVEHYPERPHDRAIADIAHLADSEGLDAHAHSVRVRGE
ncbi:MAG: histidinol dehydrogenase, partial [Planctomycetota bacterium]